MPPAGCARAGAAGTLLRLPAHLLPQPHRPGRGPAGRFAPRQLLFAHAAVTDVAGAAPPARRAHRPLVGDEGAEALRPRRPTPRCTSAAGAAARRQRDRPRYGAPAGRLHARPAADPTQPLLLQGDAGFSRKGPAPRRPATTTASRSWRPAAALRWTARPARCAAAPGSTTSGATSCCRRGAVGWDWIGINLDDGSALTAFRLRRADGCALWAGGSHRAGRRRCAPLRARRGALHAGAAGPARPRRELPGAVAGRHAGRPFRAARVAGRAGTRQPRQHRHRLLGRPAELLDEARQRVGLGYLEMTGYAGVLRYSRPPCASSGARISSAGTLEVGFITGDTR